MLKIYYKDSKLRNKDDNEEDHRLLDSTLNL